MKIKEELQKEYLNQDIEKPKYIFHGSKKKLQILEPNQAIDVAGNEINEQIGIYGSSIFEGAVPYAIKGRGKYDCEIGYRPNNLKMKIYYGVIPEDDYGYVYICDASDFSRCEDTCQYVSYNEIKPIQVVKIYYRDFKECFEYIDNYKKNKQL